MCCRLSDVEQVGLLETMHMQAGWWTLTPYLVKKKGNDLVRAFDSGTH